MYRRLSEIWRGDIPLAQAFWQYGVVYGLAINFAFSALALLAHAAFGSIVLTAIVHFAAVPYNLLVFAGVWRSADRHAGPSWQAGLAKAAMAAMFTVLLFV